MSEIELTGDREKHTISINGVPTVTKGYFQSGGTNIVTKVHVDEDAWLQLKAMAVDRTTAVLSAPPAKNAAPAPKPTTPSGGWDKRSSGGVGMKVVSGFGGGYY